VSDPIAAFYDSHPYPPPVANLDRARDEWRDPARHRAEHHLLWPGQSYREDPHILVAGCGSWQAAKYALCRPHARVVGIDVSPSSIASTKTLRRNYNLTNLELRQLPLEQAGELQCQFDLIVCTGVLHHLEDPDAGLRALRAALKPGGVVYLMLYAPYGRAGVYMIQEYCRRLGIGTSDGDIQDLIATLAALPQQHPLAAVLRGSRDARNADAMADALLNPRDRAYSVPQLLELIECNEMKFGRWYWQAPYLPQCGAIARTPHATRLCALSEREQYAAMELWRGTMTAHSVLVQRSDADVIRIRFDGEDWPRYVPIRLPWTQLVQERLPTGAAGVLLNRSHAHSDLILVIDAVDKRLFDGIDGHRSIEEIAARVSGEPPRAQAFFERLWWYDQVVFDLSTAG
jgi:SAM-dependent methyltransferase